MSQADNTITIQRIGMVGLGRMGLPIARRLIHSGFEVHAYVRNEVTREDCVKAGIKLQESLAEVAMASDVVIVCVFSQEQAEEVSIGSDGLIANMRPGSVLISHTSADPRSAQRLIDEAILYDIEVVDALLDGIPDDVDKGKCNLIVGGSDQAVAQISPVFETYGDPIFHVGGPISGQWTKLVQELTLTCHFGVIEYAQQLAGKLGLDIPKTFQVLSTGTAGNEIMSLACRFFPDSPEDFADLQREFLEKDVLNSHDMLNHIGVDAGLMEQMALAVARNEIRDRAQDPTLETVRK